MVFKVADDGGWKKGEAVPRISMFLFVSLWDRLFCSCFLRGKLASRCCAEQSLQQIGQKREFNYWKKEEVAFTV